MGSSCRSGREAEEGEARTGAASGQPFLPHPLPRRRYSVPEVVIRKFRMANEEQWGPQPPGPFPHDPLSTQPLADEWSRKTSRGVVDAAESPQKVTYQNRGSQIGGRLTYFGEPHSERLEITHPSPSPVASASPAASQVMSLIPRYSAIPRSDSMSVNIGGDGSGLPVAGPAPPIPLPVVPKGAESEDCSLVDSLEDEAVVMARRSMARAAKATAAALEESPAKSSKPQTPLVGGEAFFVAIGSSSPPTSISFSGSSPSPCSSEKHKQPERVKKASMSVGPETVSAMPKRLRDRLAQRHRRLLQKMERQRNQRKKAEEMALAKKTASKPPRSRSLSKGPTETQSKPSQPQRRVPLGHTNRPSNPQSGGRMTKPHGASGPTPASKGGTPLRTRGGTFQQKFKCIPEDRSLHLESSSSSTPPSSLSASSNSEEEEVEVDVISVEAGSETDAARLRPRLRSENAKKLGGRNRSRSNGPRHREIKQLKPHEAGISELQTIKEESKGSVENENEGKESTANKDSPSENAESNSVNKENEVQVTAVPLNDSNNNMHYSVDLQGKRVDLVSESGDTNIIIKVEQNGEAQLEGVPPPVPAPKSGSDDDSRSSKSSGKSGSKRGSLKRQKTNESAGLLNGQVSHKGKVALGIENNNEDDLVSLSCGWLNFYLMHADLKSSCEEDDSKSSRKEEKVKEPTQKREIKAQKTVTRIATHSRHAKSSPDLSTPDTNGSGFPTKLPQIVSPENSPVQERVQLTNLAHPRSRLPRPLQTSRVQNTQNSLVPVNNPSSSIVARPTHLAFLPSTNRVASDSSQAPHSSSPTSPTSSQTNDRSRHRHHRRKKGREVEWGAETSTGTQTKWEESVLG
ncbi:AF4/FMR2 family member lilli-like [Hetaerina americana]|uniref:AF4/FMR2 family member lilli-like n=1 Tax=Hetaerina americana TaxID=62018 RepID=UPI003A7F512C